MNHTDEIIQVNHVTMRFNLAEEKTDTFKEYFLKLLKGKLHYNEFLALRDVSFSIKRGESVALIGKNGSGKSTMLNTMAGIFAPDSGVIDLGGRSVALLALGVGFQGKMSGRENIILSGLLMGFSEKYVREKMPEIIEFSELGTFIDKPVNTYSSGMYSKLAFSLATELDTDILLIDEVLSVGDEQFARKSYFRMKELIEDQNHTVVIVSHNLNTLEELCDEILWIHDGEVQMLGAPTDVLTQYKKFMQ